MKIIVEFGGEKHELTPQEAFELFNELKELFTQEKQVVYIPSVWGTGTNPQPPYEVTCSGNGWTWYEYPGGRTIIG